jgi:hypothetical protein
MSYYVNASGEVKQIDADVYAAWVAADNPKADAYTAIPDPATPYDRWDGSQWVSPPPYVPQVVSRFQAKAALLNAGLLDDVEAMIDDPATPEVTKLAWAEAQEFHRQSPTVLAIASALNLADQQVDDLFIAAAAISA